MYIYIYKYVNIYIYIYIYIKNNLKAFVPIQLQNLKL